MVSQHICSYGRSQPLPHNNLFSHTRQNGSNRYWAIVSEASRMRYLWDWSNYCSQPVVTPVLPLWVVENRPSPLLWPLAYTTACTTVQAVKMASRSMSRSFACCSSNYQSSHSGCLSDRSQNVLTSSSCRRKSLRQLS